MKSAATTITSHPCFDDCEVGPHGAIPPRLHAVRASAGRSLDHCTQQSILSGWQLNDTQIAQYARNAGLHGNGLVISIAVALAESQGWSQAVLINTDCSHDRGVWQISNRWHPEVSDGQAFDPAGCAQAAYNISSGGNDWTPWTTYNNGAYWQYMGRAQTAANQVGG